MYATAHRRNNFWRVCTIRFRSRLKLYLSQERRLMIISGPALFSIGCSWFREAGNRARFADGCCKLKARTAEHYYANLIFYFAVYIEKRKIMPGLSESEWWRTWWNNKDSQSGCRSEYKLRNALAVSASKAKRKQAVRQCWLHFYRGLTYVIQVSIREKMKLKLFIFNSTPGYWLTSI